MSEQIPPQPTPEVDDEPERAPGGADATLSESDVGAASEGRPVTPEAPLSAQQDESKVPEELQTTEPPDTTEDDPDDESTPEPSA